MADKLTIRVGVDSNNNTVSQYLAFENGHVTFQNTANASLNVSFGPASPVCQGNQPQLAFDIAAGKDKQYRVCDGTAGNAYKYTATVQGANPEDPIVIIEKSGVIGYEESFALALGAVIGVGLTLGYQALKGGGKSKQPA